MKILFLCTAALLVALTIVLFVRVASAQKADAAPVSADLLAPALDAPAPAAAAVPDPTEDPGAFASTVTTAAKAGKWLALAGVLLVGVVFVLRRFVLARVDWFQTDRGGTVLAVGVAFMVGFGGALANGMSLGPAASAGIAFATATVSAYTIPKKAASAS